MCVCMYTAIVNDKSYAGESYRFHYVLDLLVVQENFHNFIIYGGHSNLQPKQP